MADNNQNNNFSNHPRSEWENRVLAKPKSGTPTQEKVNQSFKALVDLQIYLDSLAAEIESKKHDTYEVRIEQINNFAKKLNSAVTEELQEKIEIEVNNNPISQEFEDELDILKDLIVAPTGDTELLDLPKTVEKILKYLEKVATYFLGPYKQIVDCIIFYSQYTAEMSSEIKDTIDSINNVINALKDALASLEIEILNMPRTVADAKSVGEKENAISNEKNKEIFGGETKNVTIDELPKE